jgi:low affinity Fe/Cu permease
MGALTMGLPCSLRFLSCHIVPTSQFLKCSSVAPICGTDAGEASAGTVASLLRLSFAAATSPMETHTMELIRRSLTNLGVLAGHPLAFLIVVIYGLAWLLLDRENFGWHGFAVLATWFMTLLIQRAEYRDTQAIQAKLDELLHAQARARNGLTHIDEEEPEDIERHRALARKND